MAADRPNPDADDNTDGIGAGRPAEQRPPPDQPGVQGAPSRADSRRSAAAINAGEQPTGVTSKTVERSLDAAAWTRVRERIDPAGAASANDSTPTLDTEEEPAGDRVAEADDGKRSREDRFRKKAYEISDNSADLVGKAGKAAQDFLAKRPPTGHPETRTSPEVSAAPPEAIDAGNLASGLVAAGILVGEIGHRIYRGLHRGKEE
jgi:hypothetical protein